MRKSIKAIICAASAAVVCATPTAATFAGVTANTAITADAASFVSYSNNEVKFDESQIKTWVTGFTKTYLKKGNVKSFSRNDVPMLERQRICFTYKSPYNDQNTALADLSSIGINVKFYADSSKQYTATHDYTIKYTCIDETNQIYNCVCEFISYGISYEASITGLRRSAKIEDLLITNSSSNYFKVQAIPSSGEKIYAIFPQKVGNTSVSNIGLENWAKNLCLLANSLKIITDHSEDTIFIMPYSYRPTDYIAKPSGAHYAESNNYVWANNGKSNKYAVIFLGEGQSNSALEVETYFINGKAKNVMNKYLIHEMGHSYSNYTDDDFANAYMYSNVTNEIVTDDNFADVRALTAMNNCTNLKKYNIRDDARLFSIASLYDKFYGTGMPSFTFCWDQTLIKKVGFERLEQYYNAGDAASYNTARNISFANELSKQLNLGITIDRRNSQMVDTYMNYLMFVNSLRALYPVDSTDKWVENAIKSFDDVSGLRHYNDGKSFLKGMIVYLLGSDLKGV